jgi:transcriptional regulator with XRE-family HTH domain
MLSGSDLREARRRRGWTQVQAAKRLGLSQAYVSLLERENRLVSRRLLVRVQREYALQPTARPFVDQADCRPAQLAATLGTLAYADSPICAHGGASIARRYCFSR